MKMFRIKRFEGILVDGTGNSEEEKSAEIEKSLKKIAML